MVLYDIITIFINEKEGCSIMNEHENLSVKTKEEQDQELAHIFDLYKQTIYFWAKAKVHSRYISEEIVQQVFLHLVVLQRRGGLVVYEDGRLHRLLLIMTNREICNHFKREKRKKEFEQLSDMTEFEKQDVENEEVRAMIHMDYTDVLNFIFSMPDIFSSVLYLKYVMESTSKEIAHCLNLNITTVEKRLERGRRLIRRYFEKVHPEILDKYDFK